MFSALTKAINDMALGPENRKVNQYLGIVTRDSVLDDLGEVLMPQLKGRRHLQATFDKYCIADSSSHRKYWTGESFYNHVRATYPGAIISDATIALLWKSFHFYAYHPFPPDFGQDAKVDFDAFIRANLLTVCQCDGLLGTRELDWYWRQDPAFFSKASFTRLFRSIAVPDHTSPKQQRINMSYILSDAMHVLVMIGPQYIHAVPSESRLLSVAQKLFAEGPPIVGNQVVRREDVSALIHILLCLRLEARRWGTGCHFGDLVEAESGDGDLTGVLVDALVGDNGGQMITFQQLAGAIDLMPNLLLRFQQLWAVLFQPLGATEATKLEASEARPNHIGGVSLFIPPLDINVASFQRFSEQDMRLALEAAVSVSPDLLDTSMSRLSRALSDDSSAYVVLFTNNADTPNAIIGAYFPIQSKATHILFQLQPRLRILRGTKPKVPRSDLIKTDSEASLEDLVAYDDNMPYWIGGSMELGAGLRVDPNKETATLINSVGGCYTEIPAGNAGNSTVLILTNDIVDSISYAIILFIITILNVSLFCVRYFYIRLYSSSLYSRFPLLAPGDRLNG